MPKDGKIELNHKTIKQMLMGEYGIKQTLRSEAEKILASAKTLAPSENGEYRSSLNVSSSVHKTRIVYQVSANVPYAPAVEHRHSVLAKALNVSSGTRGKK